MSKTIYGRSSVNLTVDSLTFLSITANDINATNASITNIDGTNLTYTNGTITTANISTLNVSDINISQISFTTANVSALNSSQVNSSNASITNASFTTISGTDLVFTNASINSSLNCSDIDAFRIQLSGSLESNGLTNFGDLVNVGPLNITGGTGLLDMNGKNISDAGIIEASTVNVSTGNISTLNTSSIFSTGNIQTDGFFRAERFVSRDITPIVIINSSNGSTILNASSINCSFTTTMNTLQTNNANASTVNSSTGNFSTLNASSFALSSIDLTTANISTANVSTLNISNDTNSSGSFTIPENQKYNFGNSYIENNGTNIQVIGNNRALNLVGLNGSTASSAIYVSGTISLTDAPVRIRDGSLDMNNNNITNVSQITYNLCRADLGSFGATNNFNRSFIGDLSKINQYTTLPWNASLVEQLGQGLVVGQTYGNADVLYTANSNTEGIRFLNTSNINGSNFNINMSLTRDANLFVRTSIDAPTINASTFNAQTKNASTLNVSTLNVDTEFNVSTQFKMGQGTDGSTSIVNLNSSIQFASNLSGTPFTAPIFTLGLTKAQVAITDFEVLNGNLNMSSHGSTGRAIFRTNGEIYMNSAETEFRVEAKGARDVVITGNKGEASETILTVGSNVNVSNGNFQANDIRPLNAVNPYNAWNSFAMNTTSTGSTPPTFLWGQGVHIDKDSGFQNLYYSHSQIVQWVSADKAFRLTQNNREGQYEVEATVQVRNPTSNRSNYCIGVALNNDTDVGSPTEPRFGEELNGFSPFAIAYTRSSEGMRTTLRAKRIMKIDDTTDRISINTYVANGSGISLADTQNAEIYNTMIKFTYIGNYTLQTAIYS